MRAYGHHHVLPHSHSHVHSHVQQPLLMATPAVQMRADAAVGRAGVEDAAGAVVGGVVGQAVREGIEGGMCGETVRKRRR